MKSPKEQRYTQEKRDEDRGFFCSETTDRTKAAINVVQMAKSLGFFDRLMSLMSGVCGKLSGDATDLPRREERRKEKWRGQEKGTESEDPTSTGGDLESRYWDQRATEGLRALERKRMRRKRRRDIGESSREE